MASMEFMVAGSVSDQITYQTALCGGESNLIGFDKYIIKQYMLYVFSNIFYLFQQLYIF